jgi:hypothetical protein
MACAWAVAQRRGNLSPRVTIFFCLLSRRFEGVFDLIEHREIESGAAPRRECSSRCDFFHRVSGWAQSEGKCIGLRRQHSQGEADAQHEKGPQILL